jgi:integrase
MGSAVALDLAVFDKPKNEGRIARKKGSRKLYFDFFYHGIRIEKSTGLDDTPANRLKAEAMLGRILEMRREGVLEFAKLFPGASTEEIAFHTRLEKGEYNPLPKSVTFADYVQHWFQTIWVHYPPGTKQEYYQSIINYRLLPYFGEMTFSRITGIEIQKFIPTLKHLQGPKVGQPLARYTMNNILQVLKMVWSDAVSEHSWMLPDPFLGTKKHLPRKKKRVVEVFRFAEWLSVMGAIEEHYKPVTKLMVLTGLMASEIAGIKPDCIRNGYLHVECSVVKGRESAELKTDFRERRIRITTAINEILVNALANIKGDKLFTLADGRTFTAEKFQRLVWRRALEKAGVAYRKPYTTRHTFAAWSLTLGIDPNRLVNLMGHASKQMIYEVYGRYTEGLEEDQAGILGYFGEDFLMAGKPEKQPEKISVVTAMPCEPEEFCYCGA